MAKDLTGLYGAHVRSDGELIASARCGDLSAMEELLLRHRNVVYRMAFRHTMNADLAEDVLQETMLRAFMKIDTFRGEASFSSWLITIAFNVSRSIKRKAHNALWVYLDDPEGPCCQDHSALVADRTPTPEQRFLQDESRAMLRQDILKLHPEYRVVLHASILDELPIQEIARSLGITCGAAKSRLYRAKRMLLSISMKRDLLHRQLLRQLRKSAAQPRISAM
jgi:RNA polymerase sigma-70 factor (ECF subfamily)